MIRNRSCAMVLSSLLLCGSVAAGAEEEPATEEVSLGRLFEGDWTMKGRFRYAPEVDWIPTGSVLSAEAKLGNQVVLREITASQIGFAAVDLITYDPETGTAQYIYVNNESTSALIFEGGCKDGCRLMEFGQLCGPAWPHPECKGKTTITFEADDRFVARDYRPARDGEFFMSREVIYTRAGGE